MRIRIDQRAAGPPQQPRTDARRPGAAGSFLEIRKGRRRLSLHQRVRLGHDSGKSLAHRIPRRAGPVAHRDRSRRRTTPPPSRPILPFSFVRRAADYSRSVDAAFTLSPGEKIFGCGESFTRLDKRGQKVVLWTDDANGIQNQGMYKPIPFFMSSRGYGMFLHTSSPITCDFGHDFSGVNSLMIGDDELDLFVFLGTPKEILDEYTKLTGKSPHAAALVVRPVDEPLHLQRRDSRCATSPPSCAQNKIPCDVIHLDTGWFETDWRCDYEFSTTRFQDPQKMIADLKNDGFHISLLATAVFRAEEQTVPRTRGEKPRRPRRQGQSALRGRGAGFLQSANRRVVSGQTRQSAEDGRGRHQGGLRRSRAGERHLRQRPHRLLRAQSVSAALQQGRRRHHQARSPARTSSGRAAPGPAASAIRFTGAATPKAPTTAWRRNCAAACPSACADFHSGATTSAASRRTRWPTWTRICSRAGWRSAC